MASKSKNQSEQRMYGIFGALGGLVLFIGDMLFYYAPGSTDLFLNMAQASDTRIIASGITALLASWLYMLGLLHLNFALGPLSPMVRRFILWGFGSIFIAYGVVHGAYVAIATSAKIALENQLNMAEVTTLAVQANNALRIIVYPIFAVLSILFIYQVWRRKTLYPRWIIVCFPLVPFLIQGLVEKMVSGTMWVIVMGGYLNLILVLFFVASTIALWNAKVHPKAS